ncbi:hypothetical protein C8Q73DRAFT_694860 [Cubamyces lactineus]|nr:hypothetical protein C8Q73DRAFT_694860 [Cubamyces lactineus]
MGLATYGLDHCGVEGCSCVAVRTFTYGYRDGPVLPTQLHGTGISVQRTLVRK